MSIQLLHAPLDSTAIGPAKPFVVETREALLATDTEELGTLRFAIILTKRWADSDRETPEHRAELRSDLTLLRKHYSDKIDKIAMTYGIDQAIKAKEHVERTVVVPRDAAPLEPLEEEDMEDADDEYQV